MKQSEIALSLLNNAHGAVSLADLRNAGVSPETLRRMVDAGEVERPAAGHYALTGKISVMDLDWVAFALQVPDGVVGLLTAAVHHGMTQELPAYMQAFVSRSRSGKLRLGGDSQAIVDVVTSRSALYLTEGIETVDRSGTAVKVTTKERTLVDLFLFSSFNSRRRIPEESFLDSLSRCVDDPDFSFDQFHELAETFGCADHVRPFTKTSRYEASKSNSM